MDTFEAVMLIVMCVPLGALMGYVVYDIVDYLTENWAYWLQPPVDLNDCGYLHEQFMELHYAFAELGLDTDELTAGYERIRYVIEKAKER